MKGKSRRLGVPVLTTFATTRCSPWILLVIVACNPNGSQRSRTEAAQPVRAVQDASTPSKAILPDAELLEVLSGDLREQAWKELREAGSHREHMYLDPKVVERIRRAEAALDTSGEQVEKLSVRLSQSSMSDRAVIEAEQEQIQEQVRKHCTELQRLSPWRARARKCGASVSDSGESK